MILLVVYNREKIRRRATYRGPASWPISGKLLLELAQASTYGKMKRWDDAVHV
jgi:hypothetical protein